VQLDTVLQLCPNLTELSVGAWRLLYGLPVQPQPVQHLLKLRISYSTSSLIHLSEPLLQPLRLAPNLRSISLSLPGADEVILLPFVALIRERSCVQHLEQMNVHLSTAVNFSDVRKAACKEMLESCVNSLQQLHTVEVSFSQ
jgi:hypothetical protein